MTSEIVNSFSKFDVFQLKPFDYKYIRQPQNKMHIPKFCSRIKNMEFVLISHDPEDLYCVPDLFNGEVRSRMNLLMMIPRLYVDDIAQDFYRPYYVHVQENISWQYRFTVLENLKVVIKFTEHAWHAHSHHCLHLVVRQIKGLPELIVPTQPKNFEVEIQGSQDNGCSCVAELREIMASRIVLKE